MGSFGRSKIAQAFPVALLIAPRASQVRPKSDQRAPQDRPRSPLDAQEGLQNAQQGQKYLPKGSPKESERGPRGSPRPFLRTSKHFKLDLTEMQKPLKMLEVIAKFKVRRLQISTKIVFGEHHGDKNGRKIPKFC